MSLPNETSSLDRETGSLDPCKKLKLKDFVDKNAYMREYMYLRNAKKVSYIRGRYKKKSTSADQNVIKNNEVL